MRALITGGSGFVGYHLARALRSSHSLVNLDLHASVADLDLYQRSLRGDIRDPAAVRSALAGVDIVYHLAAAHHDSGIAHETYFDVNEQGTRVLLDECERAAVRRVVFTSSVAVYGSGAGAHHEDDEKRPESPYGASKLAAELVLSEWVGRGEERQVVVLRPGVVFGPENYANMYALVHQIARGRFAIVGDGLNVKSMIYVENLVAAIQHLVATAKTGGTHVYNAVDRPDLTSHEIAEAIASALGRSLPAVRIPLPIALALATPFDVMARVTGRHLPISRARVRKLADVTTKFPAERLHAAGFDAPITLRHGIERMVRWYVTDGRSREPARRLPPLAVQSAARWVGQD